MEKYRLTEAAKKILLRKFHDKEQTFNEWGSDLPIINIRQLLEIIPPQPVVELKQIKGKVFLAKTEGEWGASEVMEINKLLSKSNEERSDR